MFFHQIEGNIMKFDFFDGGIFNFGVKGCFGAYFSSVHEILEFLEFTESFSKYTFYINMKYPKMLYKAIINIKNCLQLNEI